MDPASEFEAHVVNAEHEPMMAVSGKNPNRIWGSGQSPLKLKGFLHLHKCEELTNLS